MRLVPPAALTTALLLVGCVTINIYFPASAAEKAADKIIDEIWKAPGGANPVAAPAADPNTPTTNDKR